MFERNHQFIPGKGVRHYCKIVHLHCDKSVTFIIMLESCYSKSPCVLLYTSFLPLFLSHPVLLPPFKWDEWTYLCNNAITSQRARMCERLCVLCVTYSGCWQSLILRENTDAAFCFCPCFTSRLVFISTMVIGFCSFYGRCISLWMEASSKGIHWSKRLQRPRATQPISTVSIFYECFWKKSGR